MVAKNRRTSTELKVLDDEGELNEQTIRDIESAREEFREGKTISHAKLKKELGF